MPYTELRLTAGKNMHFDVMRIGYPEEGLRLRFFIDCPFSFVTEIQLSRIDTEALIERLQEQLEYHKDKDLPE